MAAATTGINPWWSYETGSIPGIGAWMVNISNGNLLVQAADLSVPERELNFTFSRTYNTQSTHDHLGTDGSIPSAYGDGWTNSLDAHLAYNAGLNVISVYDVDGARYDYASNGSGWTAPAGQQAVLAYDGGCAYTWTKKNGVQYQFYSPSAISCAGLTGGWQAGYSGRLTEIIGRNITNYIQLTYSWAGNSAASPQNLTEIVAQHGDGHVLTLAFSTVNGYPELASITLPDGLTTIDYSYDSSNRLIGVNRPGNNVAAQLPESYTYGTGDLIAGAAGPRATISQGVNGGTITDGDAVLFTENTSNQATQIFDNGVVNFVPQNDDSGGLILQPSAPPGLQNWRSETFSGYNGTTTVGDSYGHARAWTYDSLGRAIQLQAWSSASSALVTSAGWDANNNRVWIVDPRGNETDFGYNANGNIIAVAQPVVTTNAGPLRPTTTFTYDSFNNLVAYCDPVYNTTNSWYNQANPPPTCPTGTGATGAMQYVYDYADSNEPYGVLVNTYTPLGYERTISYNSSAQFDNFGIPTAVTGTPIAQADGTTRTPTQAFAYDPFGDLTSANDGSGTMTTVYSSLNRPIEVTDADGYSSYTYYNPDGSVSKTETPYQHANSWGNTALYDADGNQTQTTVYRMTTYDSTPAPETTKDWYDGEDRLVEVQLPHDPVNDAYSNAWITRYLYDISQGNGVSFNGSVSYQAYGNLFKTQELLPPADDAVTMSSPTAQSVVNNTFQDLNGNAFDGLDRPLTRYSLIAKTSTSSESLVQESLTYDQSSYFGGDFAGELTEKCNSAQPQQCSWYNYDARSSTTQIHFSDTLSSDRSATYDPDGRTVVATSDLFGAQNYSYDVDGNETSEQEASGGGVTSPATFTHEYYGDDTLKQLDAASSALSQTGLFAYSYRPDGKTQTQTINYAAQSNVGTTSVAFTYTAAGRPTQRSESGPAALSSPTTWQYDSYGRLSLENFPTCSYCGSPANSPLSSLVWDPQNQLMQTVNATYNYSTRGEALGPAGTNFLANGISVAIAPMMATYSGYSNATWDPLAGAMLATSLSETPPDQMYTSGSGSAFAYDSAGRMLTSASSSGTTPNEINDPTGHASGSSASISRTYDDENHTISTNTTSSVTALSGGGNYSGIALYQWGANGHPIRIASALGVAADVPAQSALQFDTLHWDGDRLVFTTNSSGQVDDIKLGAGDGDVTPLDPSFTGLTFYDRGPDSSVMYCHNNTGIEGTGTVDPYASAVPCIGGTGLSLSGPLAMPSSILWTANGATPATIGAHGPPYVIGVGMGGVLSMTRTDGISDGINTIQGVRTYDGNSGQWTTPDAFPGTTDDPSSQKAYLWNGGNPFANSDPSGFYTNNPQPQPAPENSYQYSFGEAPDIAAPSYIRCGLWACGSTSYLKTIITVVAHAKPRAYVSASHGSTSVPWYKNPCVTGALGHGAAELGLDAIGFFPGGRLLTEGIAGGRALAKGIGNLGGYSGIVAIQQGAKAVQTGRGVVGILSTVGGLGDHSGLGLASSGLGLASLAPPPFGQLATGAEMGVDGFRIRQEVLDCY